LDRWPKQAFKPTVAAFAGIRQSQGLHAQD
jgi:hypothetical protein